jgi:PI31 proteasome regulator N-terminal
MSTLNKKAMMGDDNWSETFDSVRQYILQSPFPSEHPAIVAALNGIDQEVKRRHRDSRLRQKFASVSAISANCGVAVGVDGEIDAVRIEIPYIANPNTKESEIDASLTMTDDWQDIAAEDGVNEINTYQDDEENVHTSYLGTMMTKNAVASLAANKLQCTTPQAALAVALHAVLLQSNFVCTGVPETSFSGGFAAPIRDLPVGQFLPFNWDVSQDEVKLRYRRLGHGSYVLSVSTISSEGDVDDPQVKISLVSSPNISSDPDPFGFSISDHINLISWRTALKGSSKVSPVLHYKALAALITKFIQHFGLGALPDDHNGEGKQDHFAPHYLNSGAMKSATTKFIHPVALRDTTGDTTPFGATRQIERSVASELPYYGLSGVGPRPGNFDGDLLPIGTFSPTGNRSGWSGNLMGPNHPIFTGGDAMDTGPMYGPPDFGLGMKPRFDPFGPPGGPTEPMDPDKQFPLLHKPPLNDTLPGGTGNPNNDLANPPPFGCSNMFL